MGNERQNKYRQKLMNAGVCINCRSKPIAQGFKDRCLSCNEKDKIRLRDRHLSLKEKIFNEYGRKCACVGCDVTNTAFLQIDHIYNDGAKHRKSEGKKIYHFLIKNNFPKDRFQLLCANCNSCKGKHGKCWHGMTEEEKKKWGYSS